MTHAKPVDEITVHGIDEDVTECEHCGRVNLKYTVAISTDGGPIVHFGRYCAATALRVGRASITAAIKAYRVEESAAKRKAQLARDAAGRLETDRWFAWLTKVYGYDSKLHSITDFGKWSDLRAEWKAS